MNTKAIIFSILIVFTTNIFAQDHKEEIKKQFKIYDLVLQNGQWEKTLDYVYPKMFEFVPKEKLQQVIKESFSNPGLQISIKDSELKSISKLIELNGVKYALVKYSYTMVLTHGKEYDLATVYPSYQQVYGEENVSKDEANNKVFIKMSKSLYAIFDTSYGTSWFFLEKISQNDLMEMLIPKEVMEQL